MPCLARSGRLNFEGNLEFFANQRAQFPQQVPKSARKLYIVRRPSHRLPPHKIAAAWRSRPTTAAAAAMQHAARTHARTRRRRGGGGARGDRNQIRWLAVVHGCPRCVCA
jgi:hypothetical protein